MLAMAALLGAAGCGTDDTAASGDTAPEDADGAGTIALAAWVEQFDELCLNVVNELSAPGLTEAQAAEINDRGVAAMQGIPEPDEMADVAADLVDAISDRSARTQSEIDALDTRVFEAMDTLGATACLAGAPS